MSSARALVVAALLVALVAACGDDGDGGGSTTIPGDSPSGSTTPTSGGDDNATALDLERPPLLAESLLPLYEEKLADLGLRLTPRGGLIDRANGGYVIGSANGTHLALYVEPTGERTIEEFVEGILDVTVLFADDIFERWPALESFDVCQEPNTSFDDSAEPVPITQIELSRAQAADIDWDSVTVKELYDRSRTSPPQLRLLLSSLITTSEEFRAATE